MMPPFVVFPTNRIAHFVEVSLYLFYLAQQVKLNSDIAQSDIPDIVPVKCYQPPSCPFSYYNAPEKKSTSAFQKKFIKISELRGMVK